jgi:hypothetical protein
MLLEHQGYFAICICCLYFVCWGILRASVEKYLVGFEIAVLCSIWGLYSVIRCCIAWHFHCQLDCICM